MPMIDVRIDCLYQHVSCAAMLFVVLIDAFTLDRLPRGVDFQVMDGNQGKERQGKERE